MKPISLCFPKQALSSVAESLRDGALVGAAIAVLLFPPAASTGGASLAGPAFSATASEAFRRPHLVRFAEFGSEIPSTDARHVADWVADSRDNADHDFVIVDKKFAKVYVFDASARLRGATPVLLGAAPGDDSVPGIGSRPIADIRVEERTTPAGRFVAQRGRNALNEDVVWVDYAAAVSMHRVRAIEPSERRLERLASETIEDNRISWGCINVPVAFYEALIEPVFAQRKAVVYVLPEVKDVAAVFGSYDVSVRYGITRPTVSVQPDPRRSKATGASHQEA